MLKSASRSDQRYVPLARFPYDFISQLGIAIRAAWPYNNRRSRSGDAGRVALGFYHERRDDIRNVGLGPEHDWSSHCADAFGLMAIGYESPTRTKDFNRKLEYPNLGIV